MQMFPHDTYPKMTIQHFGKKNNNQGKCSLTFTGMFGINVFITGYMLCGSMKVK